MDTDLTQEQRTRQGLQWRITNIIIITCTEFIVSLMLLTFAVVINDDILTTVMGIFGVLMGISFIRSTRITDKLFKQLKELNKK